MPFSNRATHNSRQCCLYGALVLIFFISIYLRKDSLNQGLTWLNSHTLITLQNWQNEGVGHYFYSSVYNYDNLADRFPPPFKGAVYDQQGNMYYLSYGPLGLLVPYVLFNALTIYPELLPLQFFNLGLHFVGGLFVFLLVRLLTSQGRPRNLGAFFAFVAYTFSSTTLQWGVEDYFVDMLAQVLWIVSIYCAVYFYMKGKLESVRSSVWIGILVSLTILTEWIGVFFAAILFLFVAFRKKPYRLLLVLSLAVVLSFGLIAALYSSIAGIEAVKDSMIAKYAMRSGFGSAAEYGVRLSYDSVVQVLVRYWKGFSSVLLATPIFCLLAYLRGNIRSCLNRPLGLFLLLSLGSVLMHHFVFFNFTAVHSFSILKGALPLCVVAGVAFEQARRSLSSGMALSLCGLASLLMLWTGCRDSARDVGTKQGDAAWINLLAEPLRAVPADQAVFLSGPPFGSIQPFDPRIIFASRRSPRIVQNLSQAEVQLCKLGLKEGVLFTFNGKNRVIQKDIVLRASQGCVTGKN